VVLTDFNNEFASTWKC